MTDSLTSEELCDRLLAEEAANKIRGGEEDAAERAELAGDARREIRRLLGLINAHNDSCQSVCGYGELEAVRCQYRPYFVANGRRCPECPTDWKIEL